MPNHPGVNNSTALETSSTASAADFIGPKPLPRLPAVPSGVSRLTNSARVVLAQFSPGETAVSIPLNRSKDAQSALKAELIQSVNEGTNKFALTEKGSLLWEELQALKSGVLAAQIPTWSVPAKAPQEWIVGEVNGTAWCATQHFMFKGAPEGKRSEKKVNMQRIADLAKKPADELGDCFALYESKETTVAVFKDGTCIDRNFLALVESFHPNGKYVTTEASDKAAKHPVARFDQNGELVAVIMPMHSNECPAGIVQILANIDQSKVPYVAPKKSRTKTSRAVNTAQTSAQAKELRDYRDQKNAELKAKREEGRQTRSQRPTKSSALSEGVAEKARQLILTGKGPSEVKRELGCRHDFAARILAQELEKLGATYASTLRIVDGCVKSVAA